MPLYEVSTEDLLKELNRRSMASACVFLKSDAIGEVWQYSNKGGIELSRACLNQLAYHTGRRIAKLAESE